MSSMVLGIPMGMVIGMGSGIAIGARSGRQQARKDVAAWLAREGVRLTGPDGQPLDPDALLAIVAGPERGRSGNRR
ncbi:MAG: hypothetical protein KGN77_03075 [Xanthomonadaceae bacterium]|nr:hypothetical protein [Xanthomonadaceae bacterium]MDE1962813.1 hypothetical protein [Xanthomonadaceae bacterium]